MTSDLSKAIEARNARIAAGKDPNAIPESPEVERLKAENERLKSTLRRIRHRSSPEDFSLDMDITIDDLRRDLRIIFRLSSRALEQSNG